MVTNIDVFRGHCLSLYYFFQTDICNYCSYQGHHFLRIPSFWDMEPRQCVNFPEVSWQRSSETSGTDYLQTRLHIREEWNPGLHRCEHLETAKCFLILLVYFDEQTRQIYLCNPAGQVFHLCASIQCSQMQGLAGLRSQSHCRFTWQLLARVSQTLRPTYHSRDISCYVSRPVLAPPPLWLQKHADLRAISRLVISAHVR